MTDAQREIISLLQQIKDAAGGGGGAVWGENITGTLSNQTDLQTALDGKASLAQAAHSGGVIGTASFDPSAASIGSPVYTGVISGAVYTAVGIYTITFTSNQPDVDYGINITLPFTTDRITSWGYESGSKLVSQFTILVNQSGEGSEGHMGTPALFDTTTRIVISVTRLSQ